MNACFCFIYSCFFATQAFGSMSPKKTNKSNYSFNSIMEQYAYGAWYLVYHLPEFRKNILRSIIKPSPTQPTQTQYIYHRLCVVPDIYFDTCGTWYVTHASPRNIGQTNPQPCCSQSTSTALCLWPLLGLSFFRPVFFVVRVLSMSRTYHTW